MDLFFYGILQGDVAQGAVRDLLAGIGPGRPAIACGALYAVRDEAGAYPAMVAGEGKVRGMRHEAGTVDLAGLDAFEGAEYRRTAIELASGEQAEAYLWVGGTEELEPITHGDFARWLHENAVAAYAAD